MILLIDTQYLCYLIIEEEYINELQRVQFFNPLPLETQMRRFLFIFFLYKTIQFDNNKLFMKQNQWYLFTKHQMFCTTQFSHILPDIQFLCEHA